MPCISQDASIIRNRVRQTHPMSSVFPSSRKLVEGGKPKPPRHGVRNRTMTGRGGGRHDKSKPTAEALRGSSLDSAAYATKDEPTPSVERLLLR
jgi:hypothetical protein